MIAALLLLLPAQLTLDGERWSRIVRRFMERLADQAGGTHAAQ